MSEQLRLINQIKLKDRFGTKLTQWNHHSYHRKHLLSQLNNQVGNIHRVHISQMTPQLFQSYEANSMPVIITGLAQEWRTDQWTFSNIYDQFQDVMFKVGEDDDGNKLKLPFKYFYEYMHSNQDDSPLYLFQSQLSSKQFLPFLQWYQPHPFIKWDLLSVLKDQRPPHQWVLVGPARSGSNIHIDPYHTSAWNTLLQGHKKWVMMPPSIPKSIAVGDIYKPKHHEEQPIQYFLQTLPQIIQHQGTTNLQLIQFTQNPSETVFIPGGWWHAVLNLDNTIAVTHNFMSQTNFNLVFKSLKNQNIQLCKNLLSKLNHSVQYNQIQNSPFYHQAYKLYHHHSNSSCQLSQPHSQQQSQNNQHIYQQNDFEEDQKYQRIVGRSVGNSPQRKQQKLRKRSI